VKASSIFDERHYVAFVYTAFWYFSRTEKIRRQHIDFGDTTRHRQLRNRSRRIYRIHNLAIGRKHTQPHMGGVGCREF